MYIMVYGHNPYRPGSAVTIAVYESEITPRVGETIHVNMTGNQKLDNSCQKTFAFTVYDVWHMLKREDHEKIAFDLNYITICVDPSSAEDNDLLFDLARIEGREDNVPATLDRLAELHSMPYQDYLLTPEWEIRRLAQLKWADHRCQVCNTHDTVLHVHHRTYERRGAENPGDLTVLCAACHKLFHDHGKLAKPEG